jgi:hypothetical protein
MDHVGGRHFILPNQELGHLIGEGESEGESSEKIGTTVGVPRRPVWTWDWHLPPLKGLGLTAEFAYWLEMLQQTITAYFFFELQHKDRTSWAGAGDHTGRAAR